MLQTLKRQLSISISQLLQVPLFELPQNTRTLAPQLGPESHLEAGMQFAAYYANEDDSNGLRERFLSRLALFLPDMSIFELEHARCASSILYLRIIRHHPNCSIAALAERFREVSNENPVLQFHYKPECSDVFELRKQGMSSLCSS
jgi:hypothetical protein